jgi:hypothetical protein
MMKVRQGSQGKRKVEVTTRALQRVKIVLVFACFVVGDPIDSGT